VITSAQPGPLRRRSPAVWPAAVLSCTTTTTTNAAPQHRHGTRIDTPHKRGLLGAELHRCACAQLFVGARDPPSCDATARVGCAGPGADLAESLFNDDDTSKTKNFKVRR
jgi:hypothetical protein